MRVDDPKKVDDTVNEMISIKRPVIVDVVVDQKENCFPMIPSGKPHNQMILGPDDRKDNAISGEGLALV
ncbi:acetolactate synthase 3 catalytic subunit [compost metagenome]